VKYLPGCTLEGIAHEADQATRAIFKALDIKIEELEGWNCCGGMSAAGVDRDVWINLNRRNLDLCNAAGEEIVIGCPICLRNMRDVASLCEAEIPRLALTAEVLSRAQVIDAIRERTEKQREREQADSDQHKRTVEAKLKRLAIKRKRLDGRETPEKNKVSGREKIRERESRLKLHVQALDREHPPLEGWRIAAYYGCRFAAGSGASAGGQPPSGPIESVVEAFGGEVVPWEQGDACCGGMLTWTCEEALGCTERILRHARDVGARAIVTVCPLCHYNLDVRQDGLTMNRGELFQLPVFHLVELVGMLLGLDEAELWLKRHMTSAMTLIFELDRERALVENTP